MIGHTLYDPEAFDVYPARDLRRLAEALREQADAMEDGSAAQVLWDDQAEAAYRDHIIEAHLAWRARVVGLGPDGGKRLAQAAGELDARRVPVTYGRRRRVERRSRAALRGALRRLAAGLNAAFWGPQAEMEP